MKVKDLIKLLKKYPDELDISIHVHLDEDLSAKKWFDESRKMSIETGERIDRIIAKLEKK